MTAISKNPDRHVNEPSTAASSGNNNNGRRNNHQNNENIENDGRVISSDAALPERRWRNFNNNSDYEEAASNDESTTTTTNSYSRYASDPCLVDTNTFSTSSNSRPSSPIPTFSNVPWSRSQNYPQTLEGLHYEIIECFDWLRPTEQERFARIAVCQRVKNVLTTFCPEAIFFVFGSVATNLFLPSSDIDISVEYPGLTTYDMQIVASALRNSENFKDVNVLDRAYVPIIKLTDCESGINIDISFNTSRAHRAVEYILFMRHYYPSLELLTLILKQFLANRQLNQAFTGGLSSYGLILMIVHFMLRYFRNEFYGRQIYDLRQGILAEFIIKFFKFYGEEFDPLNDALAFPRPDEALVISKMELTARMHEPMFTSLLCIQDPLQSVNDVGRGAHNFMQIRTAFSSAYLKLDEVLNRPQQNEYDDGEPILPIILSFSKTLINMRKKINDLPFIKISQHSGNSPYQFGGHQPQQQQMPFMPMRATLLPPPWLFGKMMCQVPIHHHQQQHHLHQSEAASTSNMGDESMGGILEQNNGTDFISEGSSSTYSSPPNSDSPKDTGGYYSAAQLPHYLSLYQHVHPQAMYPYNPYMAAAAAASISPNSMQQHAAAQISPSYQYNGYNHNNQNYDYSEVDDDQYQNENENNDGIDDDLAEDMEKITVSDDLNINDDEIKENLEAKNSDDSDSSGLSSASSDSITACSTVTPDCDDSRSNSSRSSRDDNNDQQLLVD